MRCSAGRGWLAAADGGAVAAGEPGVGSEGVIATAGGNALCAIVIVLEAGPIGGRLQAGLPAKPAAAMRQR